MNFYFNGCSHTEGAGLDLDCSCCESSQVRKIKHNFTGLFASLFGDWELQYGTFSTHYDGNVIVEGPLNLNKNGLYLESQHGKSNDRLFLECLRSLNLFEFDYVVIQWTHPSRSFYSVPDGDPRFSREHDDKRNISYRPSGLLGVNFGGYDINVHSHLSDGDKNYNNIYPKMEPQATLQTLSYMISIQNILKEKKIKYCFINYHELDEHILNISLLSDLVDWSKFIYIENENEKTKGIYNFFESRKDLIHYDNLHHNEKGAEIIFNRLSRYFEV